MKRSDNEQKFRFRIQSKEKIYGIVLTNYHLVCSTPSKIVVHSFSTK